MNTRETGWIGLDKLMTAEEVAEVLQVKSVKTVTRLRSTGQLKAIQIGRSFRFEPGDVRTYIDENRK